MGRLLGFEVARSGSSVLGYYFTVIGVCVCLPLMVEYLQLVGQHWNLDWERGWGEFGLYTHGSWNSEAFEHLTLPIMINYL